MITTLQAAVLFALLVSPGYLLLAGFSLGRATRLPYRDFHALVQSFVASLAWIAVLWVFQQLALDDPVKTWGIVPRSESRLEGHGDAVALLLLVAEFAPLLLGFIAGSSLRRAQGIAWARDTFYWTGLFDSPTAWDHAWNEAGRRTGSAGIIEITVRLKSGGMVEGRYGARSRADLSPRRNRHLFLETAFGVDDTETPRRLLGDGKIGGVVIDVSEISSIYFKS